MSVRVRRARRDDLPALLSLFEELDALQRDWRLFTPRPGIVDEVRRKYRDALERSDALLLLAEEGDDIVGMAVAEEHTPSRYSDDRALAVSGVVVRQDRRREGIGRALLRETVRFARERGIARLTLQTFGPNREALAFWEGLGFTTRVVELTSTTDDLARRLLDV